MSWILSCEGPEFPDGEIDLIPLRDPPPDRELGFGRERIWRITRAREKAGNRAVLPTGRGEPGHLLFRTYRIPYRSSLAGETLCRQGLPPDQGRESAGAGKSSVVITCDPDNHASRKTCEALGCLWESEVGGSGAAGKI